MRLSRLNTNVLSYDISVNEKRKAMIAAQSALELRHASQFLTRS